MEANLHGRCPACFREKGEATTCPHCGWVPGSYGNPLYLPPGSELGDSYIIGKVLGHGGLGITYLAWDKHLDTRIAIKEFLPETIAGRDTRNSQVNIRPGQEQSFGEILARFQKEAKVLAKFQHHPGIVSVYRFFPANGTGYMAMEFVEGVTLKQYLAARDGRIAWRQALALLTPIMDTLREIHGVGLLHRDIAPDNIYITHDNQVKLLDFGAARQITGRSVTLSVILKEGYAPAEQYQKKGTLGPPTDIYALCATLYHCITGHLPDTAPDRLIRDEVQPPTALGVDIPEHQEAVLMRGLAIRQEERWRNIGEMQQAWEKGKPARDEEEPSDEGTEQETAQKGTGQKDKYAKYGFWVAVISALIAALTLSLDVFKTIPDDEQPKRAGDKWTDPITGMEFVWVPGGCFQMGSNDGRSDEKPVHRVCVKGFQIGRTEVTQRQWRAVMGDNPSEFKGDDRPVEKVTWNDAQEFMKKLSARSSGSYRLPTEAEWEYACRSGGKDEKYCGGNNPDRVAWYGENWDGGHHPVGRKSANGLGLYDMSGNVYEWVQDWHGSDYYANSPRDNPRGPSSGTSRVVRGGSWRSIADYVRAAFRYGNGPGSRNDILGFRCVRVQP
uniref:Formylglycine-generating enzyme, required for sulfatase activity, contains SUMF1/FGE domain n=1 Tax=Candidatus Kentrum sp. FW TaxID=2126338 RepID=A0A450STJ2_9GAMM|nr:MAG: Formylglycine-generating enzyme, required for sulfatase activity, contains SUMF1/FGE domain [Candidatus Kentron sp. FW]